MRREWGWILYKGGLPRSPEGGRQAPLPRPWAGPSSRLRGGDRPPCRLLGGDMPFFSRDLIANLKKKITLRACRPMGGRPGGIFEIFQNGHIFLKFLFFLNIKKKKPRQARGGSERNSNRNGRVPPRRQLRRAPTVCRAEAPS